jgi:hypothetical protein
LGRKSKLVPQRTGGRKVAELKSRGLVEDEGIVTTPQKMRDEKDGSLKLAGEKDPYEES